MCFLTSSISILICDIIFRCRFSGVLGNARLARCWSTWFSWSLVALLSFGHFLDFATASWLSLLLNGVVVAVLNVSYYHVASLSVLLRVLFSL